MFSIEIQATDHSSTINSAMKQIFLLKHPNLFFSNNLKSTFFLKTANNVVSKTTPCRISQLSFTIKDTPDPILHKQKLLIKNQENQNSSTVTML